MPGKLVVVDYEEICLSGLPPSENKSRTKYLSLCDVTLEWVIYVRL
jgi:hypothetical protein